MKNGIKYILQKTLGFENYLFLFSLFKIKTLKTDTKEKDFFFFLKLISGSGIALDIGANVGIMTVHLSQKMKNGSVFAFEPIPNNLKVLKKIVSFFNLKNVKIFSFALGAQNEYAEMVMPVVSSVKMQGLSHVVHPSINEFNEGKKFKVEIKKLDDILFEEKISAIKMDVENFEYFVLKGGEETIKRNKPIIYIELWENENRNKCFEFFTQNGFSITVVENEKLVNYDSSKHKKQNFIILPLH